VFGLLKGIGLNADSSKITGLPFRLGSADGPHTHY
jgi:hypothetical protein